MTAAGATIPPALGRGLTNLSSLAASCAIDGEMRFDPAEKAWGLKLWLEIDVAGPFVARRSRWCVAVEDSYPYGEIKFYPASEGGLTATFPHQEHNSLQRNHGGRRTGKLCLDSPFAGVRLETSARDPVGNADLRLKWHVERALEWLRAAATGLLQAPGDPFEIPWWPPAISKEHRSRRIVHDESSRDFNSWRDRCGETGQATIGVVPSIENALAVGAFKDASGTEIRRWNGRPIKPSMDRPASWWLWPRPIVLLPWQAPGTWGDLRKVGKAMGVDVDTVLKRFAHEHRGSKTELILLLGYPMPARNGAAPTEIHWDAIVFPRLAAGTGCPPAGFRPNARGWWERDRRGPLADRAALAHLTTDNWNADRLQARGRLPEAVRDARVAVVGVGALGSLVAELLVRAGVGSLALIDGDVVSAGNACRHVSTLADVGELKVNALANRLQQISPHVRVAAHPEGLPESVNAMTTLLDPFDAIIDCTASDDALALLARGWWSIPRLFASFSVGYAARRLFAFGSSGSRFPASDFKAAIAPWLADDTSQWSESGELLEGAGCWSPLFPARYDDIMLTAAACLKQLEAMVIKPPAAPTLAVFGQVTTTEGFHSFERVTLPADQVQT